MWEEVARLPPFTPLLCVKLILTTLLFISTALASPFKLVQPPSQFNFRTHENQVFEARVLGLSQFDALFMDGDPNGTACSLRHLRNDFSNRWCHSFFVKLVNYELKSRNVNKLASAILSSITLIPKEYLYDKNPDWADLVVSEFTIYETKQNQLSISIFGDWMVVFTFYKIF